jgi:hypothetical protein
MKKIVLFLFSISFSVIGFGQTSTDGLMMGKGAFCTGFMYSTDSWKNYWEGGLKRDNPNIGTITTNMLTYMGNYGVTDKLNVIVMAPYVWTQASGGTLHQMEGVQDLTISVKYKFYSKEFATGRFRAFGILSGSFPLTNYSPDFLPLSIGVQSKTIAPRLNINYTLNNGWFATASGSYVMRSNITLDRPSYYTDGQLFLTNEVGMPDQFSFFASIGRIKKGLQTEVNYMQQNTLGGGDIRRQDMPFASNRMNFGKIGVLAMYYLPKPKNVAVRASVQYTLAGRNVGQSTTLMAGLLYTFHFGKQQ